MRRYWIEKKYFLTNDQGLFVTIEDSNFRHICTVCRQVVGDQFELLTDDGIAYKAEIIQLKKKKALVKILSDRKLPELSKPYIELCVSIPKFNKFELIIEKSVELSVYKIHPFFSDNSFIKSHGKMSPERFERWKKIIMAATQQSGRGDLMQISKPIFLPELLENYSNQKNVVGLFPYEGACPKTLKSELKSINKSKTESIWTFVGSEGGFSLEEVDLFKKYQLEPLTLGDQVLRVETACVKLASIINYEIAD